MGSNDGRTMVGSPVGKVDLAAVGADDGEPMDTVD